MEVSTAKKLWDAALGSLQIQLTRPNFDTFLKETSAASLDENKLVVRVPNSFVGEYLDRRLSGVIHDTVREISGKFLEIEFKVEIESNSEISNVDVERNSKLIHRAKDGYETSRTLSGMYSFDSFVVGPTNELAYAAALSAADRPGDKFNPIFLYSKVGLGKTHLLHAIGHRARNSGLNLIYVSSDQFTSEFIRGIREGKSSEFRNRYRNAEVLLIDDIQFLGGKEQTQEGLFHIFNELYHNNRQIVVTSDRPPRDLQFMSDRLLSRFEWGLIADIQMPLLETKMAILRNKGTMLGGDIPDEVIILLAQKEYDSVRELEGSLKRVVAYSELLGQSVTLDLVDRVLGKSDRSLKDREFTAEAFINVVSNYFGVDAKVLLSARRDQSAVHFRHVCMYLFHEDLKKSYSEIGRLLGGRDHSSVFYACQRIAAGLLANPNLRQEIEEIRCRYPIGKISAGVAIDGHGPNRIHGSLHA